MGFFFTSFFEKVIIMMIGDSPIIEFSYYLLTSRKVQIVVDRFGTLLDLDRWCSNYIYIWICRLRRFNSCP